MNERWFADFGAALDMLEHVMHNADDDLERQMEGSVTELDGIYRAIKEEFGFTDSSDREAV